MIPLAIASRRLRKRPDDTAIHYAWLIEVIKDARREDLILTIVRILRLTATTLLFLYWASLVIDGKMGYSNETVPAMVLTIFAALISLLPTTTPASASGTMSGYARNLFNFSRISLWYHQNASSYCASTPGKHSSTSWRCIVAHYILAGPAILGASTLIITNGNPDLTATLTLFATIIGILGICITHDVINEIPNAIMRRTGAPFTIRLPLTFLIITTLAIILISILMALSNIGRLPAWANLAVLLAGWTPCLHWQTTLVRHCLGRASQNNMWLGKKWTSQTALNDLTLVAVRRSGKRIVRDLLEYETMPPTLDIGSHDLAAIAALIVPEDAVVREPDSSAGSRLPRRLWRKRKSPPQHQSRNSWLIDPSILIAHGKKIEGEDLRQFLMKKAADFMTDDTPSDTRSRQNS